MKKLAVNGDIEALKMRVINSEGQQLGIFSRDDALTKAREFDLDLVEVSSSNGGMSVCKLMNYGKYKYQQDKKARKNKHTTKIKEIRLNPTIDKNDLNVKINQIRKFIERKFKVKVTFLYKKRNMKFFQALFLFPLLPSLFSILLLQMKVCSSFASFLCAALLFSFHTLSASFSILLFPILPLFLSPSCLCLFHWQ